MKYDYSTKPRKFHSRRLNFYEFADKHLAPVTYKDTAWRQAQQDLRVAFEESSLTSDCGDCKFSEKFWLSLLDQFIANHYPELQGRSF